MKLTSSLTSHVVSGVIGAALGLIGAKYVFVNSGWSLVPWGIVGLALGYVSARKKAALSNGAVYGFFLAFVFMVASYSGAESIETRLTPFVILGLVGAVGGIVLTAIGYLMGGRRRSKTLS